MEPRCHAAGARRHLLDGFVGAVVGGFKLAVWTVFKVWLVMEAAIRDGSAEPFMEEQK
jgi:hypothetical protein